MCRLLLLLVALGATCGRAETAIPIPAADQLLVSLRREHPRLLATTNDFEQLRRRIPGDPLLKKWHEQLTSEAIRLLSQSPSRYEIPDGKRLLSTSRRVLDRVRTLALIYRLDGDRRFADRAWDELAAAAQFKDWNPPHFLDTAEMTHAFAIGYDWLYDVWTEDQRAQLRRAILEKGLQPAWKVYAANGWWVRDRFNWNQVCNGGIGLGALAIGDVEPALAGRILHAGLESIPLAMGEYAPDGAWPEGPDYWQYATSYNVVFLAALETALGTDFGLAHLRGFEEAGLFPIYVLGPTGRDFNFADARPGRIRAPELFWLARRFQRPVYSAFQLERAAPQPLDLLWADTTAPAAQLKALPLDKHFRHTEVVMLRSAWNDPQSVFVGFKAGDNAVGHSHLDLGSFVLDALGQRWAVDLGPDDYNLPDYFGRKRWTYYRLRAEGHNTLVINPDSGPDQSPKAAARIARFESTPARAFAIADLSAAYDGRARHVKRGIALLDRRTVLVQDEIAADPPADLSWFMHTPASIQLGDNQRTAILTLGGVRLMAVLQSPANAGFSVMKAEPFPSSPQPPRQATNSGISKLAVQLKGVTNNLVAVWFVPLGPGETLSKEQPRIEPLEKW